MVPLPAVRAAYERARTPEGLSESRWRHSAAGSAVRYPYSIGAWGAIEGQSSDRDKHLLLAVRLPPVIAAAAILPMLWLWQRLRVRRRKLD